MIKDEKTGLMRDLTSWEVRMLEFFDDLKFEAGITSDENEHVCGVRKGDVIIDKYMKALEDKLEYLHQKH